MSIDEGIGELVAPAAEAPRSEWLRCSLISGAAGTGKTSSVQLRMALAPDGIKLCATTGIAAVNLGAGVSTIHSTLGFFDDQSLKDRWVSGRLTQALERQMQLGVRELVLDEMSMLSGEALDCIWKAAEEASERNSNGKNWQPFQLTLIGDACQLPPVKAEKWFYEAACWPQFDVTRLDKVFRQSDPNFLAAMAFARAGRGPEVVEALLAAGVEFAPAINDAYSGATLVGKNDEASRFNSLRLGSLLGQLMAAKSSRWTAAGMSGPAEWKHIPEALHLKIGALVMLKTNSLPDFRYANGDLGIIKAWDSAKKAWLIELKRTGEVVEIGRVTRTLLQKDLPPWFKETATDAEDGRERKLPFPNWEGKWILGECTYFPFKVAYASTIHSSQGLTMSAVQIDFRNHFTGEPSMAYVSLSRCQTPQGLRIVGTPEQLTRRIKLHPKAAAWI